MHVLRDDSGTGFELVTMTLGWEPVRRDRWWGGAVRDIDMNAAAMLFSGDGLVDVVYHESLTSQDGSIHHLGDSITGEGPRKADDEIISVDLTRLSPQVTTVIFLVTTYTGHTFAEIDNAFCRLVDSVSATEIARYELHGASHTGLVMGALRRTVDGVWEFHEIDEGIAAQHPVDAAPLLGRYLR
ncbi:TerD family protein [Nocardia altamirensis]|uniref:TerD family protein n=1 Tax=Nocardia altamirensis TaxID=472158 RepID=UPI001FE06518|nr:TerD family protein [Nocardia altamirensis]